MSACNGSLLSLTQRNSDRRNPRESKKHVLVSLRSRGCAPLLAIHALGPRTRAAHRTSHPPTLCQQNWRILRIGCLGLGGGLVEGHQGGRQAPRHASLVAADCRCIRDPLEVLPPAFSLS